MVLITKGGHPDMACPKPDLHKSRMREADMRHDVEQSLQALHTDYIDLYFYHRDDESVPAEELIETLAGRRAAGDLRQTRFCSIWVPAL